MSDIVLANVRAIEPGIGVIADWIRIRKGNIVDLGPSDSARHDDAEWIDGGGRLLTPGLIDVHTHAIEQWRYEAGSEQLIKASRHLAKYGTTCVLPTLGRILTASRLGEIEELAAALSAAEGAIMPGFHLEGPFLALPGAGAPTVPGDLGFLDELLAAAGKVVAMSISPETPNILPVIERLRERGIVPFITHTRATLAQAEAAIDAGARHATHFYDVFPLPEETEPGVRLAGVVEAILADPRCSVDFIADGVHASRTAIEATLAAKGWQRVSLITDSIVGAGLPPGIYTYSSSAGGTVRIAPGDAARLYQPGSPLDGALAGSALTMDRGIGNLLAWLGLPEKNTWAMGTRNPARLLGLNGKGTISLGADADLVLWDETADGLRAARTWVGGHCVYASTTSVR
jgi:N-acetylglucosamine-6-phosphate deacetylase